jgi:hypothetical protein
MFLGCQNIYQEVLENDLSLIFLIKVPSNYESNQQDATIGKVKCILVQALRLCKGRTAQRRSRGIALLFHDHQH